MSSAFSTPLFPLDRVGAKRHSNNSSFRGFPDGLEDVIPATIGKGRKRQDWHSTPYENLMELDETLLVPMGEVKSNGPHQNEPQTGPVQLLYVRRTISEDCREGSDAKLRSLLCGLKSRTGSKPFRNTALESQSRLLAERDKHIAKSPSDADGTSSKSPGKQHASRNSALNEQSLFADTMGQEVSQPGPQEWEWLTMSL